MTQINRACIGGSQDSERASALELADLYQRPIERLTGGNIRFAACTGIRVTG